MQLHRIKCLGDRFSFTFESVSVSKHERKGQDSEAVSVRSIKFQYKKRLKPALLLAKLRSINEVGYIPNRLCLI